MIRGLCFRFCWACVLAKPRFGADDAPSSPASGAVSGNRPEPSARRESGDNRLPYPAWSGGKPGRHVFWTRRMPPSHWCSHHPTNPNHRLIMATMVAGAAAGGNYTINNIALAPGDANGCGASYHTVAWVNLPCAKAEQSEFPNVKFTRMNQFDVSTAVLSKKHVDTGHGRRSRFASSRKRKIVQ